MKKKLQAFPIVGVGASAGGLESFEKFLSAIPENSGMAYVLVQHLDPSHESFLPEILKRSTKLPVHVITDNMEPAPDHVYIIPENKLVKISQTTLKLEPRKQNSRNMPIDVFFTSLAESHKSLAMGVILSGSGHDGTVGLKFIKDSGGITFAEDPKTASWQGMPQSAVNAQIVDFILHPSQIPGKLIEIYRAYAQPAREKKALSEDESHIFRKILTVIKAHRNVDFNFYKQPTLRRRIARRMAIVQCNTLADYLKKLRASKVEQEALFHDLLIQVSMFFRDPEVFQELRKIVLPAIVQAKPRDEPIRIWSAGCATGEEAYSLAICVHEFLEEIKTGESGNRKIQIFASDLSESAIEKAREGIYTKSELQELSEERLQNYFVRSNGHFKVGNDIRDLIIFAVHNFLTDPPFSRMDLVSCRNVFIYMDAYLQKKALGNFYYALREQGFLLLGKAETQGASNELFQPVSKREKIYQRKTGPRRMIPAAHRRPKSENTPVKKDENSPLPVQQDFRKSAEAILLSKHTPAGVVIDEHMEVVHINGSITPFLQYPPGKPSFNLMKMAHDGLGFELRNLVHKAKRNEEPVKKEEIHITTQDKQYVVSVEVIPLLDSYDLHYLILFEKKEPATRAFSGIRHKVMNLLKEAGNNDKQAQIDALKNELEQAREDMRTLSEDQEATNEELQSANEELLSSNEEMQSLIEELETSKEELQSSNEELVILTHELVEKQDNLNNAVTYAQAIIATLRESLLVLDKELHIMSANEAFYRNFGSSEIEIEGKYLFSIQNGRWHHKELQETLQELLPEKRSLNDFEMELELPGTGKRHLLLNAREVKDGKKDNKLILLAIEDNTERKMAIDNYRKSIVQLTKTNEQLDQFVNVASHDLQEPLRKILTFSSRLQDKNEEQLTLDMKRFLKKIETSSERMVTLINDLLNYSRLADHENMYELTDLNEIMNNIKLDLELLIDQKKAKLDIQSLPAIEVISLQMNQLFYNLINNSLKFSKEDTPVKITVTSRFLEKPEVQDFPDLEHDRNYIELVFADNGIGFDQKYAEQIFTIFQQLHHSSRYSGNGIGLALVKRIVKNHQGEIYVKSKQGEGTEFHVILPIKHA